jgi:hypothetical protein
MSDTQDSMPAAEAMPQPGEHSFNMKARDGFAENGADEPTMSTADQENILLKEQMEKLKKFNVDIAALSKRKAEADAEESEHKVKKAKYEAEKAVEELSLAQERKKIELSLVQERKKIELSLAQEKRKIEIEKANDEAKKANDEAKKAKHEADLAVARTTKIREEWGREDEKQTKEHERLLNYLDVQKQFDLVFTQGKAEEKSLKNREKQALLEHEQEVSRNGKPNEKAMVLKAQIERDMKAEHYKNEIKQYETRSEATQNLNTLVRETKGMTEDFESSLKSIDSFISGLLPKIREYNNVQAKSREEEIVHLKKKAEIEVDIAKSKTDAANKDARMSLPIGTRVKAIMDRQGSTEKRYRKGEIIGFSGDLFKVKFDDRAQQLFQDTAIDNIILYEPAPEPNPVDDAMLDDADL